MRTTLATLMVLVAAGFGPAIGAQKADDETEKKKPEEKSKLTSATFSGLKLRGIGPALMSGRISDIAVHPEKRSTWFVAVASGGLWKTENAGTTWTPVFDGQGSYSIGCVTIDPLDPNIVWVGTGENNSQRSVGFGDGVYKSTDGGRSFKKVGLEKSEHIGKILVDPRDSDLVWVAAQGPLWVSGGDRGLYRSTDGGKTWDLSLTISKDTGVSDIVFDPRDPDVLYASAYQRRRHVWTLIDGGPESAIYKTVDGGENWQKLSGGLPGGFVGRIGLAVSPQKPDVVYAIIEAAGESGGFYRSANGGRTWRKMSGYVSSSPQYYQEIFACPHRFDRVYSMDVRLQVTEDGGKTWQQRPQRSKHVDNHALAFRPDDPDYLLDGCDGGLYESFDRGQTWKFAANLPVTQYYKMCLDNAEPFYHVYGGTQDNNTQGGPSRTTSAHGITNEDWFITVGGDGFKPQVDPMDPNIVYSQYQYGGLRRYDRKTHATVNIQPQPGRGDPPLRFNWDSPLLISPHSHTRLYYGAQRLFRSDDRGDSWRPISPDLTRQIDRNRLEVMGKVWPIDAVAKNQSTSFYGTLVSVAESPLVKGLLYTGADDGRLSVSENDGRTWRHVDAFPQVPDRAYVADIEASLHDENTVFVVLNNHKMGDFKPYILKSADRGRNWEAIQGNLPERGPVWAVAEDHVAKDLLFAGTEFGAFFTVDGGKKWTRLKSGIPTIAVRDLEIQRRENDLVCASFGRGFYILDDYTPLRQVSEALLEKDAVLFPVKKTLIYTPTARLGGRRKASQGDAFFTAPNPPFGAIFTYYLKESAETLKNERKKKEKELFKKEGKVPYPTWDALRAEEREEKPVVWLTIRDAEGMVVRRLEAPAAKGFHRVAWDLRYPGFQPTSLSGSSPGPRVVPGTYRVSLSRRIRGEVTALGESQTFEVVPLGIGSLPPPDRAALLTFQEKAGRLQRAVMGASRFAGEVENRIRYVRKTLADHPRLDRSLAKTARELELRMMDLKIELLGDRLISRHQEPAPPSIMTRMRRALSGNWNCPPTGTQRDAYEMAADRFEKWLPALEKLVLELKGVEDAMAAAGAPWTPGRLPRWKRE